MLAAAANSHIYFPPGCLIVSDERVCALLTDDSVTVPHFVHRNLPAFISSFVC